MLNYCLSTMCVYLAEMVRTWLAISSSHFRVSGSGQELLERKLSLLIYTHTHFPVGTIPPPGLLLSRFLRSVVWPSVSQGEHWQSQQGANIFPSFFCSCSICSLSWWGAAGKVTKCLAPGGICIKSKAVINRQTTFTAYRIGVFVSRVTWHCLKGTMRFSAAWKCDQFFAQNQSTPPRSFL